MSGNIRLPNITGRTTEEQLQQIKSYLIQAAGELNWALTNVAGVNGSSDTGYAPYPLANTGAASGVQQKEEELLKNFNALKGLIIKSADIVNAYYEEINTRLEGLYVSQSDYGTFVEQTTADIAQNSTDITQNYSNIQLVTAKVTETKDALDTSIADTHTALQDNIDSLEKNLKDNINGAKSDLASSIANAETTLNSNIDDAKKELGESIQGAEKKLQNAIDGVTEILAEVQAYVKSGLLYYDDSAGIPIYGVEVGQTNTVNGQKIFNQYARFTSDRLSFFDQNGKEVAYISDRKLFISNVEITVSFRMGGFEDTVTEDKGIVTKWVGGG